ncbi:hypothetical protein C8J57DRAFT_460370 [Mycena rebaudengoi]|nr:hypothetical protein C8J57DRAFT_460370 [Mycena rebaudengoi]
MSATPPSPPPYAHLRLNTQRVRLGACPHHCPHHCTQRLSITTAASSVVPRKASLPRRALPPSPAPALACPCSTTTPVSRRSTTTRAPFRSSTRRVRICISSGILVRARVGVALRTARGTSVEAVVEHKPICMHRALNSRVALRVMASHFLHKLTLYQLDIGLKRAVDVAQTPALFFPIIPTSPSARRASAGDTHKVAVHTYEVCAHAQRCGRPWAPLEPQLTTLSAAPPTAASTPRTASAYR